MIDPLRLHNDAVVIDGLVYHCDGDVTDLRAGGIDALNITICHFEADFPQACSEIARWHGIVARPNSPWLLVETAADIDRAKAEGKVGIIMGLQNIRPVADELDRFYFLRRLGLRVMQLTYNFRNAFGDGCLETEEAGLTILGRDAVRIMNELGIAIDLSHVGQRTMLGAIEASSQPVLVTHANARALANLERNKTDDIIKAVAEKGGVIGASIYGPMCWDQNPARKPTIDDYIRHLEYIVNIAGFDHIAFGTDLATGASYQRMAFERVALAPLGRHQPLQPHLRRGHSLSLSRRLQQALGPAEGDGGAGAARLEGGANSRLPRRQSQARAQPHLERRSRVEDRVPLLKACVLHPCPPTPAVPVVYPLG